MKMATRAILIGVVLFLPLSVGANLPTVKQPKITSITETSALVKWKKSNLVKFYQMDLQVKDGERIQKWNKIKAYKKRINSASSLLESGEWYKVRIRGCINLINCGNWSKYKEFNTEVAAEDSDNVIVIDQDGDGISVENDCDDSNPNVDIMITYYLDSDEDGLGDAENSTTICSENAPTGYVSNGDDSNDFDYDNDGYETGSDCNDNDSSIYITYYEDSDGDGYGNLNSTTCGGYSPPSGYKSNYSDSDDSDYFNGIYPGCGSDSYNCTDFSTQFRAQKYYEYCVALGAGDIHNLDGDADGEACESLN